MHHTALYLLPFHLPISDLISLLTLAIIYPCALGAALCQPIIETKKKILKYKISLKVDSQKWIFPM